jgi:phosphatidylglycerophosphate synthase
VLDRVARRALDPAVTRAAAAVDQPWLSPDRLTVAGLVIGLGSAVAAGLTWWWAALVLWLASRVCDGLDGPLARRRARGRPEPASQAGGFLDITADFTVYGATVVGVAVGVTSAYPDTGWLPFLLVLLAYYVNGAAFLAFSSVAERTGRRIDDGRSLSFLGGLAEGTETVLVHSLWLVLPQHAGVLALVWAGVVAVSAAHRVVAGYQALR